MAKGRGIRRRQASNGWTRAGIDPAAKWDTIEGLRYRHAKGLELLKEFPVGVEAGKPWPNRPRYHTGGLLDARAEHEGITRQELLLRRRFAFLYSKRDLDRLCRHEPPLSWSAVRWLLRVRNRKQREEFEREASRKGWTAAQLKRKVLEKRQAHRGGRLPKRIHRLGEGLDATAEAISRLETLLDQVLTGEAALARKRWPTSAKGRQGRQDLIAAAEATAVALQELRKQIEKK